MAVKNEAEGTTEIAVAFQGDTYLIPPLDEWSIEAIEALENGKGVALLKELLGHRQWARFRKTGAKMREINELAEAIAEAGGFENTGN